MATKKNANTNAQPAADIFALDPNVTPENAPEIDIYGDVKTPMLGGTVEAAPQADDLSDPQIVAHVRAQLGVPVNGDVQAAPIFMDLSNPDEEFSPIPAGAQVVAQVKGAEFRISSKGNIMIAVRYTVTEPFGPAPADAASWRNRTIRDNVMFMMPNPVTGSKGTIWRVKRTFAALGMPWTGRPFATEQDYHDWIHEQAEEMIGRLSVLELGIEDSSGVNPETGEAYPPRNVITAQKVYTAPAPRNVAIRANAANTPAAFDPDDLPF